MSEEITRKIDAEAKRHYPATNIEVFDPQTINAERARELEQGIRRSIFSNGAEFGYQLAQGEKKFKPCGEGDNICRCKSEAECGYLESQDELWEELDNTCTDANCNLIIEEAKKRYRITRVE